MISAHKDSSLTTPEDWEDYYACRDLKKLEITAMQPSIIEEHIKNRQGRIFELGCGSSAFLARCALFDWEVGGIDFNANALSSIKKYVKIKGNSTEKIILGDVNIYDNKYLYGHYDLLVSLGFLEHFNNPKKILNKWKNILKKDGLVISIIPNLQSINSFLFRKFDKTYWDQHISYNPVDMDTFHTQANLSVLHKAYYSGKYDVHMLIPWEKIRRRINNDFLFKAIKIFAFYCIGNLLGLFPQKNIKPLNSYIIGIYKIK